MMRLAGKIAIITGASSGIGKASAELFAAEGARVVAADVNAIGGSETVAAIEAKGGEAIFVETDVSQSAQMKQLMMAAVGQFGRIDILLNVAGVFMKRTPVEDVEESLWDRIYSVNVKSVFLGAKFAVPEMKRNGEARSSAPPL